MVLDKVHLVSLFSVSLKANVFDGHKRKISSFICTRCFLSNKNIPIQNSELGNDKEIWGNGQVAGGVWIPKQQTYG